MPSIRPGINIQHPVSQLILSGQKSVETRTYPLPAVYVGQPMVLIETPGKTGKFKARAIGLIQFDGCFLYPSEEAFYKDKARHHVTPDSSWAWRAGQQKWGWPVEVLEVFEMPLLVSERRGIIFTKRVELLEAASTSLRSALTRPSQSEGRPLPKGEENAVEILPLPLGEGKL